MSLAFLDAVANLNPLTTTDMHVWDDGGTGTASGDPLPPLIVPSYNIPVEGWISRENVVGMHQIEPAGMTFEVVFRWDGALDTVILGNRRSAWSNGVGYAQIASRNGQPRLMFYYIDNGANANYWQGVGADAEGTVYDTRLWPDFPPIEAGKVYHLVVECSQSTAHWGGTLRITLNGFTHAYPFFRAPQHLANMPHWDAGRFVNHIWGTAYHPIEIGFIAIYGELIGAEEAQRHWDVLNTGSAVIGSRTHILQPNHLGQRARVIICDAASNRVLRTVTVDPGGEWQAGLSEGQQYYLIHDAANCAPVAHGVYTAPISEDV